MTLAEFVEQLRMERHRQRRTAGSVATAVGVSQQTLSNWEGARSSPTDSNLRAWAAALGVPIPDGVQGLTVQECGTNAGRFRPRLAGEPVCDPCRLAYNAYMNQYRRDRRAAAS